MKRGENMAIYGKHFDYNGKSSKDFGVMIGSFSGMDEEIPMGLTRSIEKGEMTKYRVRPNHFGMVYDDALEFPVTLIKDPCLKGFNNTAFTRSEVREINAWLTSSQFPKLYHMTDYDKPLIYDEYVDYFGTFTEVSTYAKEEVKELRYTFVNDSPFGYSEEYTHSLTATTASPAELTIVCDTDEHDGYVYPKLVITPNETGKITLENVTDNGIMTIDALRDDKIYIDSQRLSIYDSTKKLITFEDLGVKDVDAIYWFRLLYGDNVIRVTGDAKVEISYREPRKVGAY